MENDISQPNSPSIENGYTPIANELLDALLMADLTGREMKIILAVARNTYGWKRKAARCSLSWLKQKTGLDTANISRALHGLIEKGLLKQQPHDSQLIGINKFYSQWRDCHNDKGGCQNDNLSKRQQKGCQNDNKRVVKMTTIKTRDKTRDKTITPIAPLGGIVPTDVISDLNQTAGKHYKPTPDAVALINARVAEGFTFPDFCTVHRNMTTAWKGGPMEKYLRPATLYRASKFQGYLNHVEHEPLSSRTVSYPVEEDHGF